MQGKNVIYFNVKIDRRSPQSIRALIAQIDTYINELMTNQMEAILTGNVAEYDLDTGQTRTRVKYQSEQAIFDKVASLEKLRQFYINMLENMTFGRMTQLVDEKNFRR